MSKMLSAVISNLIVRLYFDYELNLEEFSLSTLDIDFEGLMEVTVWGNKDEINVFYEKGMHKVAISAENIEVDDNILETFNDDVNSKFKDKLESGKMSDIEVKEYLSALLDYVNELTDNRAQDLLQKFREILKKSHDIEFKIEDVEEVKEEELL